MALIEDLPFEGEQAGFSRHGVPKRRQEAAAKVQTYLCSVRGRTGIDQLLHPRVAIGIAARQHDPNGDD